MAPKCMAYYALAQDNESEMCSWIVLVYASFHPSTTFQGMRSLQGGSDREAIEDEHFVASFMPLRCVYEPHPLTEVQ